MDRLKGKTALITGGTTGIGLATAELFRDEGATVIVTGQNPKTLEAARARLGPSVEVIASDASDGTAVAALFADVTTRHDRLDVLFLNAGRTGQGTIETMTEAFFDDVLRLNVKGPWLALKYASPLLAQGAAVVLNGSINGLVGMPGTSAYAASKGALRSLGRVAAAELAARGIRVNVLSPGPTESGIIDKGRDPESAKAIKEWLAAKIPLGRMGHVDEIAKAALFLASDDSSFMTGDEIVVDGGMTRL